jgi:hypothetical protein
MNSSQYCLVKGKTLAWRDVLPKIQTRSKVKNPLCPICGVKGCHNKICKLSMNEYYRCKRNGIPFIKPVFIGKTP